MLAFYAVRYYLSLFFGSALLVYGLVALIIPPPMALLDSSWPTAFIVKFASVGVILAGSVTLFIVAARAE